MIVTAKKCGQSQAGFSEGKVMTNKHEKYSLMVCILAELLGELAAVCPVE